MPEHAIRLKGCNHEEGFGQRGRAVPPVGVHRGQLRRKRHAERHERGVGGECTRDEICINIGDHKATDNIIARGAFTVAPADAAHVVQADYFGIATGRNVDKAAASGLTFVKSKHVDAPVIEEFPLDGSCFVVSLFQLRLVFRYDTTRVPPNDAA